MKFVSDKVQAEWNDARLSPLLRQIVEDAAQRAMDSWNWEFTITSIYRSPAEDAALNASGIHTYWRAVDVRTKGRSKQSVDDVTRYINTRWIYDPNRPAMRVCFAEPHGTGPHGHYQVHANTRRA
jgi:hypothetical protein